MSTSTDTSWYQHAACQGTPADLWFPEHGDTGETLAKAKEICASCPVTKQCLEAHLFEREGIYAGMSAIARRRLRKQRRLEGV